MGSSQLYTVTNPSSDDQFLEGDIIYLADKNEIFDLRAGGWLSENEWSIAGTNDFEVEECKTHHLVVMRGCESVVKNESCI